MAYDVKQVGRVRKALARHKSVAEKKMFGGIAFMLHGNMCCGVNGRRLMVRVGPEAYEPCLAEPSVRPMDITGRPMKGWVLVEPAGYRTGRALLTWVKRGVDYSSSLPPK